MIMLVKHGKATIHHLILIVDAMDDLWYNWEGFTIAVCNISRKGKQTSCDSFSDCSDFQFGEL